MKLIEIEADQVQAEWPRLLEQVLLGMRVVVYQHNVPIAELGPPSPQRTLKGPRPIGLAQGQIVLQPNCFDPLPQDLLDAFEGKKE